MITHGGQVVVDDDEGAHAFAQDKRLEQSPWPCRRPRDFPDEPCQDHELEIREDPRSGRLRVNRPEAAHPGPEEKQSREHVKHGQGPDTTAREGVEDTNGRGYQTDEARDRAQDRQVPEHVPRQDEDEAPQQPEGSLAHTPRPAQAPYQRGHGLSNPRHRRLAAAEVSPLPHNGCSARRWYRFTERLSKSLSPWAL